jgi:hypothetical protein
MRCHQQLLEMYEYDPGIILRRAPTLGAREKGRNVWCRMCGVIGRVVVAAVIVLIAGARAQPPAPPTTPAGVAAPGAAPLSPRNANYTITARLDPQTRTIDGDLVLNWRNISQAAASTLQFHLYYNAWRNTASSWMRELQLASEADVGDRPESDWGWIDIKSLRVGPAGTAADLTGRLRFIAPDDGNTEDRTVVEVPLDSPVEPGQSVAVHIAWTSRVPRTFARTGAVGNFFFIAQWFPKIGVLEDSGWNCHQFHSPTEFFADFGVYDVTLTVPTEWVVGATGTERSRQDERNGTTTHQYYQEDVHDFAWTTSPDYLERTSTFTHGSLPPVRMRLLLQPEHASQAQRHFDATSAALRFYGEWFGPYPYGHITIVDPAWQSGAGGMEYPTLFTAGSRWIAPSRVTQPDSVTIHEAGHQFWYGVVANNEFEHAWLDEGLNTFATARTIEQVYTPNYWSKRYFGGFIPWVFGDLAVSRATDGNRLSGYRPVATADVQSTPTWRYWPGSASAITYNKTALWLHTMERMLGWETLQRIMATFFSRFAFKHPKPADFFAVVNEVSGRDLAWFFDQVHRSSSAFDYAIARLESEPLVVTGRVDDPNAARTEDEATAYRTTVVVRRQQDGVFPVQVRVVFENGTEVRRDWDGRDRWKTFQVEAPVRARSAQVDPDRVLLLDINYTNNSAALEPTASKAARKWSLAWLVWLQDHLMTYGFFV